MRRSLGLTGATLALSLLTILTGCTGGMGASPQGAGRGGTNYASPPGYGGAPTPGTGTTPMTGTTPPTHGLGIAGTRTGVGTTGNMGSSNVTAGPNAGFSATGPTKAKGAGNGGTILGPETTGTNAGRTTMTTNRTSMGQMGGRARTSVNRIPSDLMGIPGKAATGSGQLMAEGGSTLKKTGRALSLKPPKNGAKGKAGIFGAVGTTAKKATKTTKKAGKTAAEAGKKATGAKKTTSKLQIIGFTTNDLTSAGGGLASLAKKPGAISYLSPLWFSVTPSGQLVNKSQPNVVAFARKNKIPIMPLINNQNTNDQFLKTEKTRLAAENAIVAAVKRQGFAGVSIDFQGLKQDDRVPLNTFMDSLSARLRPSGKLLTVNIIPTLSQAGQHGAYDEATLARYADQLILMTYDHHDNTSPPGPISPHAWVVNAVKHALHQGVPAHKIYLGVNTYGYNWNTTTKTATTIPAKQAATIKPGATTFNAATKEANVQYTAAGDVHVVWYGNTKSMIDKVNIAKKMGLHGLAIWEVGMEQPNFWTSLEKLNGKAPRKPSTEPLHAAQAPAKMGAGKKTAAGGKTVGKKAGKKKMAAAGTKRASGKKKGGMKRARAAWRRPGHAGLTGAMVPHSPSS